MKAFLRFMKRQYKFALIAIACSTVLSCTLFAQSKNNTDKDKALIDLLTYVIDNAHYNPVAIDDNFSKGVYKSYLEALDPTKRFFTQADINEFAPYETKLDDQIKMRDISFFTLTYDRLLVRTKEAEKYYRDILAQPFDFSKNESINVDYEKQPYPKNDAALRERWEKQLKLSVLSSVTDKEKLQEGSFDKVTGKDDTKNKPDSAKIDTKNKSFAELEKEAREATLKSLDEYFDFVDGIKRDEWFSIYLNTIVERFDPHTSYFAPDDKEKFDTSMRGSLEGIGARLQKKGEYIEISELIPGGPAWRGKELEQGDMIMKVGQAKEDPIDIAGMRLDDVVKKIKGPKGTEVRLTVKKVDGSIKVYSIIREVVEIEETYAKSSIVNKNGKKYGIIYLPKFYIDFENQDNRDAAKDMAIEVERLKKEGIEGLIVDLRDNGGGSLKTVVDITGLFIPKGPVVQVRERSTDPSQINSKVLSDTDSKVQWDGPLVVLVNNFSASASEIFAAAIQDYNRGIIMGSKQTYGKGTVQNVYDLNNFVRSSSFGDLGALKTTTQKFYRISGGSTQREGVKSDIILPDKYSYIDIGERDSDNALPWDKIPAAQGVNRFANDFTAVKANSKKRIEANEQFKLMDENAHFVNDKKDENTFSLNIEKFKAEQDKSDNFANKFKELGKYKNNLVFEALPYEKAKFETDASLGEKKQAWFDSLSKDIYVEEALNVLDDMQANPKTAINLKSQKELNKTR
jgi:carboxyl-terminal processing protease